MQKVYFINSQSCIFYATILVLYFLVIHFQAVYLCVAIIIQF